MEKLSKKSIILIANLVALGLCLLATFALFGSGLTYWVARETASTSGRGEPTRRVYALVQLPTPAGSTGTPTPTVATIAATASPTPIPTYTPSPLPTATPTTPPTDTPLPPPTNTPPAPPPTATLIPTDTPPPAPAYPFVVKETGAFPTSHPNFDVFIGVTDDNNRPLSNYRVIGVHSNGWQVESPVSAGDWTENSGAMHYKAGNIKYVAPNSPSGVWTLQLVDAENKPVGPPVEFSFDEDNPTWYFLLYERE